MDAFYSGGLKCGHCHSGPLLSAATWDQLNIDDKVGQGPVVNQPMNDGKGNADKGFFNIGVRPVAEDIGRAALGVDASTHAKSSRGKPRVCTRTCSSATSGATILTLLNAATPTRSHITKNHYAREPKSQSTLVHAM